MLQEVVIIHHVVNAIKVAFLNLLNVLGHNVGLMHDHLFLVLYDS